ncbi:MAG: hypothetical protein U0935_22600 [Pirellulales bacterium]
MNRATFFVQECSTCGRRLEVRVELLGRQVECPHCHRQFVACDPQTSVRGVRDGGELAWIARADALLSLQTSSRAAS